MDVANSPRVFTGSLSATEMEPSEDYTYVLSRRPNPRTTHVFYHCTVECCYGVAGFSALRKGNGFPRERRNYQPEFSLPCHRIMSRSAYS
ncbi:hypothetical protein SLA2020_196300 [Shorea laevis]